MGRFQAKARGLALLALAAGCSEKIEGSPTEAAGEFLRPRMEARGLKEGADWEVLSVHLPQGAADSPVMNVRVKLKGQENQWLFRFTTREGRWQVEQDLGDLFMTEIYGSKTVIQETVNRFAERIRRRFSIDPTANPFKPLGPDGWEMTVENGLPTARVTMRFDYGANNVRGQFIDIYRYKEGAWRREGDGYLFDAPPAPRAP